MYGTGRILGKELRSPELAVSTPIIHFKSLYPWLNVFIPLLCLQALAFCLPINLIYWWGFPLRFFFVWINELHFQHFCDFSSVVPFIEFHFHTVHWLHSAVCVLEKLVQELVCSLFDFLELIDNHSVDFFVYKFILVAVVGALPVGLVILGGDDVLVS